MQILASHKELGTCLLVYVSNVISSCCALGATSVRSEFPKISLSELVGFVDAAHATDVKKWRSITGWAFCYAGAAIAYKSKLQTMIATRSTEAEFMAAVHAAKTARYL